MKERTYDYWHKKMQLEERVAAYNEHLSRDAQPLEWLMENLKEDEKDNALLGIEKLQAELDKHDEEAEERGELKIIANETRDKITFDFMDDLSDRHHDEWSMFLEGFEAAFEMSGLTQMPCDVMMIFDSYMDVVRRRLDEEGE